MPKLTKEIRDAINKAIDNYGSQSELARVTNVSQENLSKYISNGVKSISARVWRDLEPFVAPYLSSKNISNYMHNTGVQIGPIEQNSGNASKTIPPAPGPDFSELEAFVFDSSDSDISDKAKLQLLRLIKKLKE